MKDDLQSHAAAHARYWNLLPWWVNGTLSSDEAHGLEQHVAVCAECTAELGLQRELQAQIRSDAVLMAPQSAWQKMAERLNNEDEALALGHFKRPRATNPWRWAVAAQAILIVGLVLWQQVDSTNLAVPQNTAQLQPRYETLTSTTSDATIHGSVRVVFRQDIALTDVNALLRQLPAQIVAGPSEAGVYTLSVLATSANTTAASEQASAALKQLRADARVIFAEPADHK